MQKKIESASLSRRAFLGSGVGASLGLFHFPKAVFAAFEADADAANNDVVLRFAAMSDVHFNGDPDAPEPKRLAAALKFMYEYSASQPYKKFDALVVAGDVSNHGLEKEIALFKKTVDDGLKNGTQLVICMGNHEFYGGNKPLWEKTFGVVPNRSYEANGFRFIALSPDKGSCREGDYSYALDWFEKELDAAEAADPDKPIFVLQHYHITPTVYGSRGEDNWGIPDLFATLQKRPRVVDFSGHSHYPINDPRSAWQGGFSAFGTGTLSYFEMGSEGGKYDKFPEGYRDAAQMYVVEVRRDNSVVLKPFDLVTMSFFDVVYAIAKPGDVEKYLYTDARYKTSACPIWSADAAITLGETNPYGAKLEFPQAACADVVHSYRVDVEKRDAAGAWAAFGSEYFWSEYYFRNPPKTMNVELADLEEKGEYRVEVVALNPFFKESERALKLEFSTPDDPTDSVDKNAPKPDANMLDLSFATGEAVDAAGVALDKKRTIETIGAPKFVDGAAVFDGDDCFKIAFDSRDYAKLRRATLAAKFKIDAFPDGSSDVFANTEGRGVAFEIDGKEKRLEFWASIDGTYQIISAPIELGKWIDAFGTFDGNALVLYLDGKEVARQNVSGKLTHPKDAAVQAFCVGADVGSGGSASGFFNGAIERARIFSWALTAAQVENWAK